MVLKQIIILILLVVSTLAHATDSALANAILARNSDEAIQLIKSNESLDYEIKSKDLNNVLTFRNNTNSNVSLAIAAAALGLPEVLKTIGTKNPNLLFKTDKNGRNALAYAVKGKFLKSTKYLLQQGLNPIQLGIYYPYSDTALAAAVLQKDSDMVELLLQYVPNSKNNSIEVSEQVWLATYLNDTNTLIALLQHGASPDYIAPQGNTALISAVMNNDISQVKLLLTAGAILDTHMYRGYNILDYAKLNMDLQKQDANIIFKLLQDRSIKDSTWKKSQKTKEFETLLDLIETP